MIALSSLSLPGPLGTGRFNSLGKVKLHAHREKTRYELVEEYISLSFS